MQNQEQVTNSPEQNVPNFFESWTKNEDEINNFFTNLMYDDKQSVNNFNYGVTQKSNHAANDVNVNNGYYFNGENLLPNERPTYIPIEQYIEPNQTLPTLGEYLPQNEEQIPNLIVERATAPELPAKFKCPFCDRSFTKVCYLSQHVNAQHNDQRQFKCSKCGKKFASQETLALHAEKHQGDKPHKCRVCPKQYNFRSDLNRHMFVHDRRNSPYICTSCGKGFARRDHFKNHCLSHERKAALYNVRRNMNQQQF
ncbi:unnamed protein product [Brassicogethes aeneus]|uniref:C2H2-type domain-containing protein n=1 Tax=Brassicogethes aeneus TaxID=1431903 RepID=A0A9P0AKZ0_BRAAE|nr:unnamed protein product [Brassicogethes aeneus]